MAKVLPFKSKEVKEMEAIEESVKSIKEAFTEKEIAEFVASLKESDDEDESTEV